MKAAPGEREKIIIFICFFTGERCKCLRRRGANGRGGRQGAYRGWKKKQAAHTGMARGCAPGAEAEREPCGGGSGRRGAAADVEIDRIVYVLYGLTEEEIAIVEGTG